MTWGHPEPSLAWLLDGKKWEADFFRKDEISRSFALVLTAHPCRACSGLDFTYLSMAFWGGEGASVGPPAFTRNYGMPMQEKNLLSKWTGNFGDIHRPGAFLRHR